jgi:2,4-dienoyl-CoA reductase-like NADH-dependent reductase (Old Yellow Enzyme family)
VLTKRARSPLQKIGIGPLYQLPFAEQVRREADLLTGAVGLIVEPLQAEEIIFHKRAGTWKCLTCCHSDTT